MFETMEQYMMYHKAMLMGDKNKAIEILRVPKGDPRECKRLGKEVCTEDDNLTWNEELCENKRESIVIRGSILKIQSEHSFIATILSNRKQKNGRS